MTTRADVNRLARSQSEIVGLARRDLQALFASMDLSTPERVRDALLEVVPVLVRAYGDVAAMAAAEWYEETRAAQVGGSFAARVSPGVDAAEVQGSVRWAAGHLFGDRPVDTLALLSGAIQRHILYSGRDTIRRNVDADPARPGWARVPTGAKTCAFCTMLAGRGFVYSSARSAGGDGHRYHDDCDCQVVAEWDREQHHIEGYDPDRLEAMYETARDAAKSGDPSTILARMREMFPDEFTDGHKG